MSLLSMLSHVERNVVIGHVTILKLRDVVRLALNHTNDVKPDLRAVVLPDL